MGLAPVPFSPIFASTNKPQIIKKQIPFLLWKIIDQSDKISHLLGNQNKPTCFGIKLVPRPFLAGIIR
jgi:hypothetical protein